MVNATATASKARVKISKDEMEAWIFIPDPLEDEQPYTVARIMDILAMNGVKSGIDQEMILRIAKERLYNQEFRIAAGVYEENGVDGYFEYLFNTDFDRKPKLNEDGTVDYWSINVVEMVEAGQVIARYHEPIQGKNGMSVKGKVRIAKRGRPLVPLRGKGFTRSADNSTYTSDYDGKIEFQQDRLVVSPIYEIFGDADLTIGNIDFKGDVVIHGNVSSGIKINAGGSVTIDGLAEACNITAGKDVTIRGGMMGDHRGSIDTKGELNAKFLEYCTIDAEGTINASSFYGCQVSSKDMIVVSGGKSAIVGGAVYAVKGIQANSIGNDSEISTEVHAGVSRKILARINELENNIEQNQSDLTKISEGLRRFDSIASDTGADLKNDPRRVALLRTKITKQAEVAANREELKGLELIVENAKGARIVVEKYVYPGVQVFIGDLKIKMKEEQKAVEYRQQDGQLKMFSLYD